MKLLKQLGELVSPNDPELVEKTLSRLQKQDEWNDVFSTHLIDLLKTNDALKGESKRSAAALAAATARAIESGDAFDFAKKETRQASFALTGARAEVREARLECASARGEAQRLVVALQEASAKSRIAAAALEEAKHLNAKAEQVFGEARRLTEIAGYDLKRAEVIAKEAAAAEARASTVYRRLTSTLIAVFALLGLFTILMQAFWAVSSLRRNVGFAMCGFIVVASLLGLWRLHRES